MAAIDDYEKFLASKPPAEREFRTLEFFHVDFSSPLRFVQDFVGASFLLESAAPRDPLTIQAFDALSMQIREPAEGMEGTQILSCSIGATNDNLQNAIDLITPANALEPVECIYRKYYSGNLLGPVLVLNLSVTSVEFDGYTKNNIIAEDQDLASKSSGEIYTLSRFPTLRNL